MNFTQRCYNCERSKMKIGFTQRFINTTFCCELCIKHMCKTKNCKTPRLKCNTCRWRHKTGCKTHAYENTTCFCDRIDDTVEYSINSKGSPVLPEII